MVEPEARGFQDYLEPLGPTDGQTDGRATRKLEIPGGKDTFMGAPPV